MLLTTDWQKDQCLPLSVGAICPGRSVGAGCARRGDARAPRLRRLAPKRLLAQTSPLCHDRPGWISAEICHVTGCLFSDPGGVLAITDAATVSRSFSFTTFGLWARVKSLSITLTGLSHTFPADLDFLFVGPDQTNLAFWSDAGGTPISNQNYTIRDSAAALLPSSGGIATGIYRPADYGAIETNSNWTGVSPALVINHPTPNGAATLDGSFGGKWIDNTTWTLFVRDDASPDSGTLNDWGIQGGFKRSSQHPGVGGCDEHSKAAVGSVWTSAIAVTGSAPCGGAR